MPLIDLIDVYDGPEGVENFRAEVFAAVLKHIHDVKEVRARGGRGARGGRPRVLVPAQQFVLDLNDDPTDLARAVANKMLDQITADAAGDAWRGHVELLGAPDDKGRTSVLDSVKIDLAAGSPIPKSTREDEIVGIIGALSKTIADLGTVVVRVGSTKADELQAYGKMVSEVADMVRRLGQHDGKWSYKMHKETEETARQTEEQRSRAQRSANFWAAAETFAEEFSTVAEVWSTFFAGGGRGAPTRPTSEELEKIFVAPGQTVNGRSWSDIFDPIRAVISTMLAESDPKIRMQIAKTELRKQINALSVPEQEAMKLRMVMVLGELRTKEVAAWLAMPLT